MILEAQTMAEIKLGTGSSSTEKVAGRLINVCLVLLVLFGWAAQHWPGYTYVALAGAVAVTIACIAYVVWASWPRSEEPNVETKTLPEAQPAPAWHAFSQVRLYHEHQLLTQRLTKIRAATLQSYVAAEWTSIEALLAEQQPNRGKQIPHYVIEPPGKNFVLNFGIVRVEVNGDNASIKVSDVKNLTIDSPVVPRLASGTKSSSGDQGSAELPSNPATVH
jgi:hypothetical protein